MRANTAARSDFENCRRDRAVFDGGRAQGANFERATLVRADFTDAGLEGANLERISADGARFELIARSPRAECR